VGGAPSRHTGDFVGEEIRSGEACAGPLRGRHVSCLEGFLSKPAVRTVVRSIIFAWLDLLQMESSGSKARRGAAWMWPKEGWPAQHAARSKREAGSQFGGNYHGGAPGAGGAWGAKTNPSKLAIWM
jgi:hypothetical protein